MATGNETINLFCFDFCLNKIPFVRGGISRLACAKRILECLETLFDVRFKIISECSVEKVLFNNYSFENIKIYRKPQKW